MEKEMLLDCGIERKNCPVRKWPNMGLDGRVECRHRIIYSISDGQTARETILGTCRMMYKPKGQKQ